MKIAGSENNGQYCQVLRELKMRKREIGIVTSDGADKTRRVEVERVLAHAKYGKIIRRRTVCHVHDEENASKTGDRVEIVESRPLSRLKRWRLVKVL